MYGKSNMHTYITICEIDSQQEFAIWLRKLQHGLCINLEGWDGERDRREAQKGGGICIGYIYMQESGFDPWMEKIPLRMVCQFTFVFLLGNPMNRGSGGLQPMHVEV